MHFVNVKNDSTDRFFSFRIPTIRIKDSMKLVLTCASLCFLNGCSTVIDGKTQVVTIATNGTNAARCSVLDSRGRHYLVPRTPGPIILQKDSGDLDITCHKKGFQTAKHHVDVELSVYTLIGLAGIIPGVVDLALGNQFAYDDVIIVNLEPGGSSKTLASPLQTSTSPPLNPPYFSTDTETSLAETGRNAHTDTVYHSYTQQKVQLATPVSPTVQDTLQPIQGTLQPIQGTLQPIQGTLQPIQGTLRPDETAAANSTQGGLHITAPTLSQPSEISEKVPSNSSPSITQNQATEKYSLQAGAYKNQANAQKVIQQYQAKGYGAWIYKGQRLNYVRIGNFKSLEDAKASKDYFKNAEGTNVIIVAN